MFISILNVSWFHNSILVLTWYFDRRSSIGVHTLAYRHQYMQIYPYHCPKLPIVVTINSTRYDIEATNSQISKQMHHTNYDPPPTLHEKKKLLKKGITHHSVLLFSNSVTVCLGKTKQKQNKKTSYIYVKMFSTIDSIKHNSLILNVCLEFTSTCIHFVLGSFGLAYFKYSSCLILKLWYSIDQWLHFYLSMADCSKCIGSE